MYIISARYVIEIILKIVYVNVNMILQVKNDYFASYYLNDITEEVKEVLTMKNEAEVDEYRKNKLNTSIKAPA